MKVALFVKNDGIFWGGGLVKLVTVLYIEQRIFMYQLFGL